MRDASHSFAVSAPWPGLLSRVVLQDDDGIKPDLDGRSFIVVLDKTEQSSDYHVIKPRLVIRCSRKNGVSSSLKWNGNYYRFNLTSRLKIPRLIRRKAIRDKVPVIHVYVTFRPRKLDKSIFATALSVAKDFSPRKND